MALVMFCGIGLGQLLFQGFWGSMPLEPSPIIKRGVVFKSGHDQQFAPPPPTFQLAPTPLQVYYNSCPRHTNLVILRVGSKQFASSKSKCTTSTNASSPSSHFILYFIKIWFPYLSSKIHQRESKSHTKMMSRATRSMTV